MTTAILIKNLYVNYNHTPAVAGVSLEVAEGEFLGIIGPNGGGKSTLLKAILGLVPIASGEVYIYEQAIPKNRSLIGYVPQSTAVDRGFPISVAEAVITARLKRGLHPLFKYSKKDKNYALECLEKVGIENLAQRQISELSGGEFQRLLLARALCLQPKILLLDEPTASVDPASSERIYELLNELNQAGKTILLVTHDLMVVASAVGSLACLNQQLVYHGKPELTEPIVNQMYGCPVDLIAHGVPHRVLRKHDGGHKNA